MGRPIVGRSIKRSRLRALDMSAEHAGQLTPSQAQVVGSEVVPSSVAAPRPKAKRAPAKKAKRVRK